MEYKAWDVDVQGGYCGLTTLQNVDRAHELSLGVPRAHNFPHDARFDMNPEFPKLVKLPDNVYNGELLVVVSSALAEAIENLSPADTELLPVAIYNHKGRLASPDYRIVNPLRVVDCIDLNATDIEWNAIEPDQIASCVGLVLDPDRIDSDLLLFRPKRLPHVVLVREDTAESLSEEEFTGLSFVDLEEFEF